MTVQTPQYLQKKVIPARFDRQLLADIFRQGVVGAGDLVATPNGGTTVSVAKGKGYIPGTLQTDQGVYRLFNDAAFVVTHDAAVTNPRMDSIIMRIQDSTENNNIGNDLGSLEINKGTESATVTRANRSGNGDASLPANAVIIADVIVRPGTAIQATDIVDRRLLALLKADPGDVKWALALTDPLGWKFAAGQPLERNSYADLLAKTTIGRTGTTTNASATISNLSTTADLYAGMGVTGNGIPVGTYIQTIVNGTSITLSTNATATAVGVPLTFYTSTAPSFSQTGTMTNASNVVTGLADTSLMYVGMPLTASGAGGVGGGTYVASIVSATSITMSANATASGSATITFYPHGAGDSVSTFNAPDMRGMSPLGSGKAGALTNRVLGATGGEESHQQSTSEMASHSHAFSGGQTWDIGTTTTPFGANVINWPITGYSGPTQPAGGGNSHNNMQPFKALRPLIYTGVPF